jgi:hypothetical protein
MALQVPRIDISAPANAIEYHPALLAHADENGGVSTAPVAPAVDHPPLSISHSADMTDDESLGLSDVSSDCGDISTDDEDSIESVIGRLDSSLSPGDRAEQERFGAEYTGPKLDNREASRLLILMGHASTCPCQHSNERHAETCRSVKWMMLHVRDCPGTTANFDVCPFPWCRKVKHLLYHLVSCQDPASCEICSPSDHGLNLIHLQKLNEHRFESFRDKLLAKFPPSTCVPSEDQTQQVSQERQSTPTDDSNSLNKENSTADLLERLDAEDDATEEGTTVDLPDKSSIKMEVSPELTDEGVEQSTETEDMHVEKISNVSAVDQATANDDAHTASSNTQNENETDASQGMANAEDTMGDSSAGKSSGGVSETEVTNPSDTHVSIKMEDAENDGSALAGDNGENEDENGEIPEESGCEEEFSNPAAAASVPVKSEEDA